MQSALKENHGNTKNINFQFHHHKFSQQRYSTLINGYLRIPLRKNLFIDSLVEKIMKMLNASIFNFIILNLVKKGILDFHVTTATYICLKEVIRSSPRRAL